MQLNDKAANVVNPPQDELNLLSRLYSNRQFEDVVKRTDKLMSSFPKSFILCNISGAANAALKNYSLAINSYEKALLIRPNNPEIFFNLGNTYKDQNNLDAAIKWYKAALKVKPDYAKAFNNLGLVLQVTGYLDDAVHNYEKAVKFDPENIESYNNLGNALKEKGDLKGAISAYKTVLSIYPKYATAYVNLGIVYKDLGDLESAFDAYSKALALDPKMDVAKMLYATLLFQNGQFDKAADIFQRIPTNESQTYLLKCLYQLDKKSEVYKQIDYITNKGEINAVIGSYISRSEVRYGIKRPNPFCKTPLQYVQKTDLKKVCDFKKLFVDGAASILNDKEVQKRSQGRLKNGIQTAGNVFNQGGEITDEIQRIILSELNMYRKRFTNSREGFILRWPKSFKLSGWLISMKSGGKLSPHIHDTGWVTGSIYINVPSKVKADSGNLVVSISDSDDRVSEPQKSLSLDVVTGDLCLFPSSLLHHTIPFESNDDRIVLAFDVIPT